MTNTYDAIGRITQRRLGLNSNYDTALTYKPGADGSQTALLATYQNGGDTPYSYEYDANGNITEITQGNVSVTYSYNAANELIRENNGFTNQTVTYTYDNWGNITQKDVYAYTTAADPGTPTQTIPYAYTNSSWGDQLTSYNNQSIVYDAMGNPTSYLGQTLTWRGKQLTAAGTMTYEYDENGLRLNKTVNNVSTDYYYNGSILMSLVTGNDTLLFSYDASGQVAAVNHNGTYYYYLRNGQGDIVKLIDNSGATVVEYTYDTWGKQLSCTGTLASTLGALNPFRYRGYVYDEETQWYYLRSRYYDPTTCRFISADILLSTGQGVLGNNCYAYCLNNPVSGFDPYGLLNWTGVAIGLTYFAVGVACLAMTVASYGTAAPVAAAIMISVGTAVGSAAVITGATMTYAAATDSTMVMDVSSTINNQNNGVSIVVDFKNETTEYYHHVGAATEPFSCTYGVGLVSNYEKANDYGGTFVEFNASKQVNGVSLGWDVCSSPTRNEKNNIVKASSTTVGFSINSFILRGKAEGRIDYYYSIGYYEW